ncbi:hypothetical protein TNCV_4631161 [Trichonephila clavipes]|nr:hypothetical protein TNCV_4631161 [Trichonephila clavipes]
MISNLSDPECLHNRLIPSVVWEIGANSDIVFVTRSKYENPVSWTVVTHVGAPVALGPRIIDTADTALATPPFFT